MIILELQTNGRTGSRTRQKLDGTEWKVEVFWLAGEGIWVCSLFAADGTKLPVQGRAMRHRVNLLDGLTGDLPPGALVCWDTSNRKRDPGRFDLDRDGAFRLIYVTAAEIATAASGAA